MNNFTVTL